ncbi:MAG: phosphoglycerate kinase [Parcubacteria group bacterium Licking1014_17]|nr:MAG: phosphoglycerate kinase [Parcubacteria group bacterium Licking1014_17]
MILTMKYIDSLPQSELSNKKILVRVDFNLPVEHGRISSDYRVQAVQKTIDYLLGAGAKVALLSHITDIETFSPIVSQISEILGKEIFFVSDCVGPAVVEALNEHNFVLLENVRRHEGEEKNDDAFAQQLAKGPALSERSEPKGFDFYVNDAFAVAHRKHASVSAITKYIDSYAGFLMKDEIENLSRAIQAPAEGKVLVLGGAKISTKLPVVKHFLDKAERILIGGALANNFLKFKGLEVGKSLIDAEDINSLEGLDMSKVVIPEDVVTAPDTLAVSKAEIKDADKVAGEEMILDIGTKTAAKYADFIGKAGMVIWNGPMGLSETEAFAEGTRKIAEAVAAAKNSIIGGGDTISEVTKLGLLKKYSFVSIGGGAMLIFLGGEKLPALEALRYY